MRKYVRAKIHGLKVTRAALDYHGSVGVDGDLLQAARIDPYECVLVVNLTTGARWETYAIPAGPGEFHLNGGSAHLGSVGDRCLLMAFVYDEAFTNAEVLMIGADNAISEVVRYER